MSLRTESAWLPVPEAGSAYSAEIARLDVTIQQVTGRLVDLQRSDGSFARVDGTFAECHERPGDCLLGHSGATAALALAVRHDVAGAEARRALRRAAAFLADRLTPVPDRPGVLALMPEDRRLPENPGSSWPDRAAFELAGRSLTALAMCRAQISESVSDGTLKALARLVTGSPHLPRGAGLAGLVALAELPGHDSTRPIVVAAVMAAAVDSTGSLDGGNNNDSAIDTDQIGAVADLLRSTTISLSASERITIGEYHRRLARQVLTAALSSARSDGALHASHALGPTADLVSALARLGRRSELGPLAGPVADCITVGQSFLANGLASRDEADIDDLHRCLTALLVNIPPPEHEEVVVSAATAPGRVAFPIPVGGRPETLRLDTAPWSCDPDLAKLTREAAHTVEPVQQTERPGLFRLASDVAARSGEILYRSDLVVVGPGCHIEAPDAVDRHAWGCRRRRLVLTGGVGLTMAADSAAEDLPPGRVVDLDPLSDFLVENRNPHPVAVLDIYSRPRTPGLTRSAFEQVASGIDVAGFVAELERRADLWTLDTRRRRLRPHQETWAIPLRDGFSQPSGRPERPGERQRSRYLSGPCTALPRLASWLDDHCRRANLEPGLARVVMLAPGGHVLAHVDRGSYYRLRDRYHLVLTGGSSTLTAGRETIHPQPGELWRFDNQLLHEATNRGTAGRIHLIFDAKPW